jgi:AraC family transcriptional activator of pobA
MPAPRKAPSPARRTATRIPAFALYGEAHAPGLDLLHIEAIRDRSLSYQWEIEPHVHHGLYQVVWVEQGAGEVALDLSRAHADGPAAIVLPPGTVHGFRFTPETQGWVLTLSARFLVEAEFQAVGVAVRDVFAEPRIVPLVAGSDGAARLSALLSELAAEFAAPGAAEAPLATWIARAVVWRLAQECARAPGDPASRASRHQALFTRFVLLVEQHFLEHWSVAQYARRLGLSAPRLNRLARAEAGRTAAEVLHERLTREACRRLLYVPAPVNNVAAELGFEDPAYFCRFFKRRTGMSPGRWRMARSEGD